DLLREESLLRRELAPLLFVVVVCAHGLSVVSWLSNPKTRDRAVERLRYGADRRNREARFLPVDTHRGAVQIEAERQAEKLERPVALRALDSDPGIEAVAVLEASNRDRGAKLHVLALTRHRRANHPAQK